MAQKIKTSLSGKTKPGKLDFLFDTMNALGMNCADAGEVCGISASAVNYWRIVDDCRLSQAEAVLASRGFSLSFAYILPGSAPMRVTAKDLGLSEDGTITVSPVAFIGVALKAAGISWSELCRRIHVDTSTSRYWKKSSIPISRIWEIADACGFGIDIRVEKTVPVPEELLREHDVLVRRHLFIDDCCVMNSTFED